VGGGTIAIAGITYYVLPRVLQRPVYSRALSNVSFWLTVFGVFGFYCVLIPIGVVEGSLVHQGMTYEQAKQAVGPWHSAPEAVTAAIMGTGYWIFVTNVIVTIWQGRRDSKSAERFIAKFFIVSVVALLLGTLQGVYQVLPWSLDWLYKTGAAGQLIDPISHAHMNLVGGVVFAFMGFVYYFLPRILRRPMHSTALANVSFWFLFTGVFAFWLSNIILGFTEGDMVITQGITPLEARHQMGIAHSLPLALAGATMGIGFWTFIANVALTLRPGFGKRIERYVAIFIGISTVCLFFSTSQGMLQVLPSTYQWLSDAREAGELITPWAHAQLNIIGVVTLTLTALGTYIIPLVTRRPLYSHRLAIYSMGTIVVGVFALYLTFLVLGFTEGQYVLKGDNYAQARQAVTGGWHDWILTFLYAVIGVAYFGYAYNIFRTVGKVRLAQYTGDFGRGWSSTWGYMLSINVPAASLEQARREALQRQSQRTGITTGVADSGEPASDKVQLASSAADSGVVPNTPPTNLYQSSNRRQNGYVTPIRAILGQSLWSIWVVEALVGYVGFLGAGWFKSRRPAMAMLLFVVWVAVFWICTWAVLTLIAPEYLPIFIVSYIILPQLSGFLAAKTYSTRVKRLRQELAASLQTSVSEPSESGVAIQK
jgi:cytochrome c oxidase cbb3-type subunit 1